MTCLREDVKLRKDWLKFAEEFFIKTRGQMPQAYKRIGNYSPELLFGFTHFYKAVTESGALPQKVKELIIIALETAVGTVNHELHVRKAMELGATPQEIHEAIALAFLWLGMEAYLKNGTPAMDNAEKIWAEKEK